jgi:hypothetical protein
MNGISRFAEVPHWVYSKQEDEVDFARFDYLVGGQKQVEGFNLIRAERGEPRISTTEGIALKESVFVLERI